MSNTGVSAGALVRFQEPPAWVRYRWSVLTGCGLVLAQTALIAGLLAQRRRRRRAEDQLQRPHAELLASDERIRDLGARLLNAQETERTRIARGLWLEACTTFHIDSIRPSSISLELRAPFCIALDTEPVAV